MRGDLLAFIAESKGEKLATAISDEASFTISCESGFEIKDTDFSTAEYKALIKAHQDKLQAEIDLIASKRITALAKLEALGLDEGDLKALGL